MIDAAPAVWLPPAPAVIRPAEHSLLRPGAFRPVTQHERHAILADLVRSKRLTRDEASRAMLFVPVIGWGGATQKELILIDRTAGTNIGDLTANGGLAAAFDGSTSQAGSACAAKASATGYIGKTLAGSKIFGQAIVYGSNNFGWSGTTSNSITINIRGKTGGAPSGPTDGTVVGTITFTETANESGGRTISSSDLSTAWAHLWADISTGNVIRCAEIVLYEWA